MSRNQQIATSRRASRRVVNAELDRRLRSLDNQRQDVLDADFDKLFVPVVPGYRFQ